MKLREELCKSMGCAWIAAGVAAADLWLKKRAERRKESSRNRGAFLNLGQERPELVRALSAGLTALVSALFLRTPFRKGSRLKKAAYGSMVRRLNSLGDTCIELAQNFFRGEDYLNFPQCFQSIEWEDAKALLEKWCVPERVALSVICPVGTAG